MKKFLAELCGRTTWRINNPSAGPGYLEEDREQVDRTQAHVASSLTNSGKHRPVLDIDFKARLFPSGTPGHFHLYLDGVELEWEQYEALLCALKNAGVIEEGYYEASVAREQTFVRLPERPKGSESDFDAPQLALGI